MNRTLACLALVLCVSPTALAQELRLNDQILKMVENADANNDGDVTRQEFKDYRLNEFPRLNRNQDNYLSKADMPVTFRGHIDIALTDELIADFDSDGDGKISRREFDAGPTRAFNLIDKDGNGIATRYEIAAARAALKNP